MMGAQQRGAWQPLQAKNPLGIQHGGFTETFPPSRHQDVIDVRGITRCCATHQLFAQHHGLGLDDTPVRQTDVARQPVRHTSPAHSRQVGGLGAERCGAERNAGRATGSRVADAVGQMDADFSHPPEKLVELVNTLAQCDVAIGSRYVKGGSLDEKWPLWRKGLSSFGNFYARTILSMPLRDCTGGFRLYRREVLSTIPLGRVRSNGYVFQVEMAYLAHRLGFQFKEIPIYFADRRWGQSKMSFRIQLEAAVRVWQLLFAYRDLR